MRALLLVLIRFYQWFLSPFLPVACRFSPTCSHYAHQAIRTHGAMQGGLLAAKRLLKCHPWGGVGYDPVKGQ